MISCTSALREQRAGVSVDAVSGLRSTMQCIATTFPFDGKRYTHCVTSVPRQPTTMNSSFFTMPVRTLLFRPQAHHTLRHLSTSASRSHCEEELMHMLT